MGAKIVLQMKFFQILCCCIVFASFVNIGVDCAVRTRQKNALRPDASKAVVAQPVNANTTVNLYKVVSRGINRIALTLNYILSRHAKDQVKNLIYSPLNIVLTLTTVMLGTAGQTEKEIAGILGIAIGRKLDQRSQDMHKLMGKFLNRVTYQSSGVNVGTNLNIAGGVFVQNEYPIKQSYIENAKSIYNNDVFNVDFSNGGIEAASIINKWISEKTHGRIDKIIDPPIDPRTKAVVAGALYFNGDWEYPFIAEATKWQPFFLKSDGKFGKESVQVQLMVNEAEIPYYEDNNRGFQAIGIPYKNKDVYMYMVLPRLRTSLNNLTINMTPQDIETIVEKSKPTEVFYVVPKMELQAEFDLRSTLDCMGIRSLFNPATANFSNLAEGIYVSEVLHKVDMEVNELGTIAAAATATSMNRGGYANFRADRPFFFFIYNVKIGIMTFWGKIQKPTPWK